jgi:hypothetical protein
MVTKYLKRGDFPVTTITMVNVLKRLRMTKEAGHAFAELNGVRKDTIEALIVRDWIVQVNKAFGEMAYTITGRGLKALIVYEKPSAKRTDGICCRCSERPTGMYGTGRKKPYCDECMVLVQKRQRDLKGQQANIRTCPQCKKWAVKVCSTGRIKPYCDRCLRKRRKQEKRRKRRRLLYQYLAGCHLPCPKCGEQRYCSGNTVQDYCYQHYREYQNEYLRRRSKKPA